MATGAAVTPRQRLFIRRRVRLVGKPGSLHSLDGLPCRCRNVNDVSPACDFHYQKKNEASGDVKAEWRNIALLATGAKFTGQFSGLEKQQAQRPPQLALQRDIVRDELVRELPERGRMVGGFLPTAGTIFPRRIAQKSFAISAVRVRCLGSCQFTTCFNSPFAYFAAMTERLIGLIFEA